MSDALLAALKSFHREVLRPDVQQMLDAAEARTHARFEAVNRRFDTIDAKLRDVDGRFDAIDARFRDVDGHFDSVYQRFDRLETEYHMLVAAVRRVEGRE